MKKGFTLIELLAVIVILAIIAVIAVPIVLNIIDESKENSTLRSADFYLDAVELSVGSSTLKEKKIADGNYNILESGNLCLNYTDTICTEELEVEVNGEVPKSGTITLKNGIVNDAVLGIGGYTVTYSHETKSFTASKEEDKEPEVEEPQGTTLASYIENLYTPNSTVQNGPEDDLITYNIDTTHGLIDDGFGGTQASGGNIRYYGLNVANYIDIGDRTSDGEVIPWRIIGLFKDVELADGTKQNLVKVVRNDAIGKYSLDYNADGTYDNNWGDSTLKALLNGAYYNSTTASYYNQSTTPTTVDLTSIGLSDNVKSKVANVIWHGANKICYNCAYNGASSYYANDFYANERGTLTTTGNIGLIYSSDYMYATNFPICNLPNGDYNLVSNECGESHWMYSFRLIGNGTSNNNWTITSNSVKSRNATIYGPGSIGSNNSDSINAVRPVLYLNADVLYDGGTGVDIENAYVIK